MALFDPNRNRKGTGFTNINRVLGANQGNQLGNTVSSSVQNQANDVRGNVQKSQQQFQEEADKNRIDTKENEEKRDNVIGRFETKNFTPDESKYQVSTGLSDQYNQNKNTLQTQLTDQQKAAQTQRATIQTRIDADNAEKARLQGVVSNFNTNYAANNKLPSGSNNLYGQMGSKEFQEMQQASAMLRGKQGSANRYDESIKSLTGLLGTYDQSAASQDKVITDKLANLESQYGEMGAAEKAQWIETERDKMIAANLPTDAEIQDFGKYRAGIYNGPKELQDSQTLLGNANEAEQVGNLTRSTGGRQELLRRYVGGNDYTQGQQRLDTMLLGQNNQGALNQARKATQGLQSDVVKANEQAGNVATDLSNRAKIFGDETVGKLNTVRNPVDSKINARLAELQKQDAGVGDFQNRVGGILGGTDANTTGMDRMARLGLGLQSAQDAGYLQGNQLNELMGDNGLIKRAESLGLDTNKLINERMMKSGSQNLNRGGAATSEQEAQLTSLDRLLGKTGTDIEFNQKGEDYQAGKMNLDTNSLRDYIKKTEAEKMKSTPGYQAPNDNVSVSPMQQYIGGTGQAAGGAFGAAVNGGFATDLLTGKDNTAQMAEGAINMGAGSYGMQSQARNAAIDGIMKLNIGGNSIANTEGGKQLSNILNKSRELENEGLGQLTNMGLNRAQGVRDLTSNGKIDQAIAKLSGFDNVKNIAGNVGKSVKTALGGGQTGNWGAGEYGTIDAATGKSAQIGSFANQSSDNILKQMMSAQQMGRTNSFGGGGAEGATAMNTLMAYYQNALKREKT